MTQKKAQNTMMMLTVPECISRSDGALKTRAYLMRLAYSRGRQRGSFI